jgi:4-methyl-5(b-hydroxyethyl)-thiazole monophosphate biosynthesis
MINILLADGFEEIEALTVVDILRRAEIGCQMVSIKDDDLFVTGRSHIIVKSDVLLADVNFNDSELIVLPGGMPGTANLESNSKVQQVIKKFVEEKRWIASICAAPSILGKANYLKDVKATCYPGFEKVLHGSIVEKEKVIIDKNFITSRGAGTALDFALEIVKVIKGENIVHDLKKSIVYYENK